MYNIFAEKLGEIELEEGNKFSSSKLDYFYNELNLDQGKWIEIYHQLKVDLDRVETEDTSPDAIKNCKRSFTFCYLVENCIIPLALLIVASVIFYDNRAADDIIYAYSCAVLACLVWIFFAMLSAIRKGEASALEYIQEACQEYANLKSATEYLKKKLSPTNPAE